MKEKISILIADDEENILKILSRHLKKKELYVKIARDGEEAIELFFTHRFDILLADLAMPDIDGIDLFKKIKKFSPSTLLFLMTGFGTVETVVQAIKAGAMNYLSKPFRMEQLDEILSEAYEIIRKRRKKIEEAPETKISLSKKI